MSEKMRIDKLLAHAGFGTRSEIKKAMKQGLITVAGEIVKDPGLIVRSDNSTIAFGGTPVLYKENIYLLMNKPAGVVSATEDVRDRTVLDLLADSEKHFAPFPVGRLDKDTVGLLLLTNDGQLAHQLLSPKKQVPKTYEAIVLGTVNQEDQTAFMQGVTLDDGYVTLPAQLTILDRFTAAEGRCSLIHLTIHEGKFHQVKRMFLAVGKKVLHLKRITMGTLHLDESLPEGTYRELTEQELADLQAIGVPLTKT
ncbi:pseudouridine synthase [Paenibacillus yanchengensis]|uniref:Pseudouridine synthase n=1 Tax=Paenibacillus yanchengensis TaxID=2035833 RepID=A0ABW4YNN1_9BACL